ncbi:MAG: polyphosphate kinase 2 family protein [Victivallaceae bacterium]
MDYCSKFMVKPGSGLKLSQIDPAHTGGFKSKDEALKILAGNQKKLADLQYKLYAEGKQSLLIVLQALDAGGKDGTINHVLAPMNPQGCRVAGFKAPTPEELSHDFLWRIHRETPKKGEVVIFNRSHYEDVLVGRVHNLVPRTVWSKRYEFINDFEKLLAANNTRIIKFFLYISKDEQLRRFASRLDETDKHWKISEADYKERQFWDDYLKAFEDAISKCASAQAPWFVIPANHKWFRNLAVSQIVVETLESMKMKTPEASVDINEIRNLIAAEEAKSGGEKLTDTAKKKTKKTKKK